MHMVVLEVEAGDVAVGAQEVVDVVAVEAVVEGVVLLGNRVRLLLANGKKRIRVVGRIITGGSRGLGRLRGVVACLGDCWIL